MRKTGWILSEEQPQQDTLEICPKGQDHGLRMSPLGWAETGRNALRLGSAGTEWRAVNPFMVQKQLTAGSRAWNVDSRHVLQLSEPQSPHA